MQRTKPVAAINLPPHAHIAASYMTDETELVSGLIAQAEQSAAEQRRVRDIARRLVKAARSGRREYGGIDSFLGEYGLSNEEGIVLMCLAEALLRVPDAETADRLIADKILTGDWKRHLGRSDSILVNASTWGLMLTGRVISLQAAKGEDVGSVLKRLVAQSGEPVIREAMRHAMRVMGKQFVLGSDITEALEAARDDAALGYSFSFDMLGEAAHTAHDAERYFERYMAAMEAVAAEVGKPAKRDDKSLFERPSISIKLSALHPRYEASQEERVRRELGQRLLMIARTAKEHWLGLAIDAEEADRLSLSLDLYADLLSEPDLLGWNGLGLVVQAYGKRGGAVIDWLAAVAKKTGRRLPVRLVKGAYWDSEIKFAQEQGLAGYPVFTRKANTDVSYLASARKLLAGGNAFYSQFATHNAHTIASVMVMAGKRTDYEFQRLHGMGEALYADVISQTGFGKPTRIYAPVGEYEDLLAYLVRRLLENGVNTSFVNRLADDEMPISEIIADPVKRIAGAADKSHPQIPTPRTLFEPGRKNSSGIPLWESHWREPLLKEMNEQLARTISAGPIMGGKVRRGQDISPVFSPHDRTVRVGRCGETDDKLLHVALNEATRAAKDWDELGGTARADILERAADLLEENHARLMAVMVREAGKTIANALGDVREATDFLRYYAMEARRTFEAPLDLKGPTGELNQLSLHGRGVFACISPWNFPLAIFTGQVAAALAAGNAVVAKPAEQTPITAFLAVKLMHEAGVPGSVLHLATGPGSRVGAALIEDERVQGVAFTGSNETANLIEHRLAARKGTIVPFIAETGGINAMIVDSTALPEQVTRDVLQSAFDSAGQRCSALRVLFLQEDVADRMQTMILGAMEQLRIGDPLDYKTDIGPVIDQEAQRTLEAHKKRMRHQAKELIDLAVPKDCRGGTYVGPAAYEIPSIDVLKGEVFGPILHIVRYRANRLKSVCDSINATGFGLTLGIHSRIQATADFITDRVNVGNIYVNRNQIGAVVGVQPFGGVGLSGTGPKAGGPHYLPGFADEKMVTTDLTSAGGNAALLSLGVRRDDGE